ncbi:MAG TPA: LON peptidase substrate-binding domain-containing protein [Anaerolineales bacterium]|nr:LON peptidase substrate-binding domain-containing protein [Anaerolineales bacterium]
MLYNPVMFSLPLFPLNTVLFPGLPLRLNIFEPRYKQMLKRCLETGEKFGVVLIKRGREALGPLAEPFLIGCTAQLMQVDPTSDERYNITAIGRERFRILSLDRTTFPYLTGTVEIFPFSGQDATMLQIASQPLRHWVKQYFEALAQATNSQMDSQYIPSDPVGLAFLATYLLQIPPEEKQEILEVEDLDQLLHTVVELYRREVALIKRMSKDEGKSQRGFWLN